jgi:hypothetical protein
MVSKPEFFLLSLTLGVAAPSLAAPSRVTATFLAVALQGCHLPSGRCLPLAAAPLRAPPPPLVTADGLLPSAVTMPDDADPAALRSRLDAIIKDVTPYP